MKTSTFSFALVLIFMGVSEVQMLPDGMKQLTKGFVKVLELCKKELGLSDGVLTDMFHLWKEEYDQVTRDTGCMINCMSKKLQLLDEDGKLHHENAKDYVLKNGGDEDIAGQLVTFVHDCEKQQETAAGDCEYMLEVAKCLRRNFKQIQWTPKNVEVVITEIISDA